MRKNGNKFNELSGFLITKSNTFFCLFILLYSSVAFGIMDSLLLTAKSLLHDSSWVFCQNLKLVYTKKKNHHYHRPSWLLLAHSYPFISIIYFCLWYHFSYPWILNPYVFLISLPSIGDFFHHIHCQILVMSIFLNVFQISLKSCIQAITKAPFWLLLSRFPIASGSHATAYFRPSEFESDYCCIKKNSNNSLFLRR